MGTLIFSGAVNFRMAYAASYSLRGTKLACGCSSDLSINQFRGGSSPNKWLRNLRKGCRTPKLLRHVYETKNSEPILDEVGVDSLPVMDLTKGSSICPSSMSDLFKIVEEDLQILNKNLQSIIGLENPVLVSVAEQIFGAGGKRMRPALVFLVSRATAEITGSKELTEDHRRLAETIELIHTASLIHDDILDESDMRRGKKTVNQLYGTRVALLAGDFMFAHASWYLANLKNLEVIKLISQVIKDFARGEIKQALNLFDCDIQLDEYLAKSYYKTASLIAAGTKGGAIFSGVSNRIIEQMYQFGKNLGLAFQIVDDILDFTQSAEQLGKPAGSDLVKGNLTAPVIFALEEEPKLRDMIKSEFRETGSLDKVIEIIKNCGSMEQAWELAREKANQALVNLECLPPSLFKLQLELMVKYNLKRIT